MSLPYVVTFRGKPACPCLATWLPAYEKELIRRGVVKTSIDIYQLIGGNPSSGGTHTEGGAFDIHQISDEAVQVARWMGADATWHRPKNWDGAGGIEHTHGVLRGCDHNGPARYQISAVDANYNGLGHLGHGSPDDGPRPLSKRTWQQGIEWARTLERPDNDEKRKPPVTNWQKMYYDRVGCSLRGIDTAVEKSKKGVRLDTLISKEGVLVGAKNQLLVKDGYQNENKKYNLTTKLNTLLMPELKKFKRQRDGYRIIQLDSLVENAGAENLLVEIQPGADPRFAYGTGGLLTFVGLREMAEKHGVQLQVVVSKKTPNPFLVLKAAHRAGLQTVFKSTGTHTGNRLWWRYIDYVRGPVIWKNN